MGDTSGPLFRQVAKGGKLGEQLTAQSVALVVKEAAHAAKLDSAKYSGHPDHIGTRGPGHPT